MFGSLKRLKNSIGMTDFTARNVNSDDAEHKSDKKFILALIIIGAFLIYTLIRAFCDPEMQSQIKMLKISAFDIGVFAGSLIGYFIIKKPKGGETDDGKR